MTQELTHKEIALLRLIEIQAREITELEHKLEQSLYNRRFTNTKHLKENKK